MSDNQDTGATGATPIDTDAFIALLSDTRKFVQTVERGLRGISPKLSVSDLAILRQISGAAPAEPPKGKGKGDQRKSALSSLQERGLIAGDDDNASLTAAGTEVLSQAETFVGGLVGAMNDMPRPVAARMAKAVNQTNRAMRGHLRGSEDGAEGGKEGRQEGRQAAKAARKHANADAQG